MKLTINQIADLLVAHKALDGYERVVKDSASERVIKQGYDFSFGLRMQIAANIEALDAVVKRFNREREKLALEAQAGGEAGNRAFVAKMNAAIDEQIEVDLERIDFDQLRGDENPYPPTVLAGLMPLRKKAA